MEEESKVYKALLGKPEEKRRFGRPRRRWENGIGTDIREIGWGILSGFSWLRIWTGGGLLWTRW
jgi:hypothetical protein